jgi:circadian clock protein KaiB
VDVLSKKERDETEKFENEAEGKEKYLLRLYVTGMTPRSTLAIQNIKKICEERLKGRYELEVVDIYQNPERAKEAELVAAPTLIKRLPLPLRKLVGDMSNTQRVLIGLNLQPKNK